ncbi:hypothetical protein ACSBR2_025292 [Camellia fascicularis]
MINITTSSSTRTKSIIGCSSSSTALEAVVSSKDLLTQILLRVPPKSLLRFKSVSKYWFLLISDSHFSLNHARQNQPNHSISGLYFCYDYWCSMKQVKSVSLHDNGSLPTLSFLNGVVVARDSEIRICSSCNGLLLCKSNQFVWNPNTADLNVNTSYIICNVTTQKYKLLPQTCQHLSRSYAYLAFDPSKSPHYKVLLVFERIDKFNIYSSESSSWKQIDLTTGPSLWGGGAFWNGAIHWLGGEGEVHTRFDFDAEKLTVMPIRPKILSEDKTRYFGECCGRLLLIQMPACHYMEFKILDMNRDYSSWNVNCNVNLAPLIDVFSGIVQSTDSGHSFDVASVEKGENEHHFALVLFFRETCKFISYNVKLKTVKVLIDLLPGNFDNVICHYGLHNPFRFIESMSPV